MTNPRHVITVATADSGSRLDRWLMRWCRLRGDDQAKLGYSALQSALRKGAVRIRPEGQMVWRKARPEDILSAGTRVKISPEWSFSPSSHLTSSNSNSPRKPQSRIGNLIEPVLLWRNEGFMVINKPQGWASQGGTGQDVHVDSWLRDQHPGARLVHRLDRATSGAMVVARDRDAAAWFAQQLQTNQVKKTYWAMVHGRPKPARGQWDAPMHHCQVKLGLQRDSETDKVGSSQKEEQTALSMYGTRAYATIGPALPTQGDQVDSGGMDKQITGQVSWMVFEPVTGRTHQLRLHAASAGHPIWGDDIYGRAPRGMASLAYERRLRSQRKQGDDSSTQGDDSSTMSPIFTTALKRLMLHARSVSFTDMSGNLHTIVAPMDEPMTEVWSQMGWRLDQADLGPPVIK